MTKIVVYYHKSDLDGICSAAIVHYFFKHHYDRSHEISFVGVDYGDKPSHPVDTDIVYVLDFSFPPATMLQLATDHKVFWCDHHKTALDSLSGEAFDGLRDTAYAGCELTWKFLFPDVEMPFVVEMLGRYDVWDHGADPDVQPVQFGMRYKNLSYDSDLWRTLFEGGTYDEYLQIRDIGRVLVQWDHQRHTGECRDYAYGTNVEGWDVLAMNCNKGSQHFDSMWDPTVYDLMCAWKWTGDHYTVSLYSTKPEVDCSAICKRHGGGGHKGAAGFICTTLPAWVLGGVE